MTDQHGTRDATETALYLQAVAFVRESGCRSFIELALVNPSLWAKVVDEPAVRLRIAVSERWTIAGRATVVERGGFFRALDAVLNLGTNNPDLLWVEMPEVCEALRAAGDLERLLACLGVTAPAVTLDPQAAAFKRIAEQLPELAQALEAGRDAGWPTQGGVVTRLAELMLARLLESNGHLFEVIAREGGISYFLLHECASVMDFRSRGTAAKAVAVGFETVVLDDRLLASPGDVIAFANHMNVTLMRAGIVSQDRPIEIWRLFTATVAADRG